MEEVWKELSLSSLRHTSTTSVAAPPVCGLTLQEFLACPLSEGSLSKAKSDEQTTFSQPAMGMKISRAFGETETVSSFHGLASTAGLCACSKRKRGPAGDENAIDRKKERLMKNRESADRSRAKKQAYTNELELKVAHLMEENAKLRKEQEKICVAGLGHQHQKKHKLYRTLTAPF